MQQVLDATFCIARAYWRLQPPADSIFAGAGQQDLENEDSVLAGKSLDVSEQTPSCEFTELVEHDKGTAQWSPNGELVAVAKQNRIAIREKADLHVCTSAHVCP